jgi:hypothetical protein
MSRSPRVRCGGCAFEWFGPTSAHGLRIVGACPRCGGVLDFLVPIEDDATPDVTGHVMPDAGDARAPATVLGTPLRR